MPSPLRPSLSIRTHLLGVVVIAAVVWIAVAGASVAQEYRKAERVAVDQARDLATEVAERLAVVDPELAGFLGDLAKNEQLRSFDPAQCDAALAAFSGFDESFGTVAVLDDLGQVRCGSSASLKALAGTRVHHGDHIDAALAGESATGDLATDPVSGAYVLTSALPIESTDGRSGVMVFGLSVQLLDQFTDLAEAREDMLVVVTTSDRSVVVGHSGDHSRYAAQPTDGFEFLDPGADALPDTEGVSRFWATAVGGEHDWVVHAGLDADAAYRAPKGLLLRTAEHTVALIGLLVLLSLLLSRRLIRPIQALVATIEAAKSGEITARASTDGPRELSALAREYNSLIEVRAEAEATQAEQLSFINAVANSLGEGVYAVDLDDRITFVNPAALELSGRSHDEVVGANAHDLLHRGSGGLDQAIEDCAVCRPDDVEVDRFREHVLVTAAGELVPVSFTAEPIVHDGESVGTVVTFEDITERQAFEARLTHQALHDPLTGLPNRALFHDRLEHALRHAGRTDGGIAVLFLDLDRFKVVNDSLGHDVGDQLLVRLSERFNDVMRPGDTIARFGGDEFVVLCNGIAGYSEAVGVAERLMAVTTERLAIDGNEVACSVSIGIAVADDRTARPASLLRDADAAMYRAKEHGRNRYEIFDEQLREKALRRFHLEGELRQAIDSDDFHLVYQPIVSLPDGQVSSVEALLRWEAPAGPVSPVEFVPVAEDSGLIVPIGAWVLSEACRQIRAWRDERSTAPPLSVAVNLSVRQLGQSSLFDTLRRAIRSADIDPTQLTLEVTETALMEDMEYMSAELTALKTLGVQLAIDDFGTGYSSLSYLAKLPVDIVKIDGSFVQRLCVDEKAPALVAAMVEMAHALDKVVVAEGIEEEEQAAILADLGCHLGQGYWFHRPTLPDAITPLLGTHLPLTAGTALARQRGDGATG